MLRGPVRMACEGLSVRLALGGTELGRQCRARDIPDTQEPPRCFFMHPNRS